MTDGGSPGITVWILFLRALSLFNIGAWFLVATRVARSAREVGRTRWYRELQLLLSACFVFGCAFRSILPRADVQRICLFDTVLSVVFIGRSVATVAEMAFMTQWALLLRESSRSPGHDAAKLVSRVLVPIIFVAELWSWYAVLTTNYLGNVIEQTTWTVSSALVILGLLSRERRARQRFVGIASALIGAYVVFMSMVDVPMYFRRWRADEAAGRTYLSLAQGVRDSAFRRVVTRQWDPWREEVTWMSLYFSTGVWVSLWLVRASPDPVIAGETAGEPAGDPVGDQNVTESSLPVAGV